MTAQCINHPDKPAQAHGLCMACYQKQRRKALSDAKRKQQPGLHTKRPPAGNGIVRVLAFADRSAIWSEIKERTVQSPEPDGCWEWIGPKTRAGYGLLFRFGYGLLAHRLVHALSGGDPSVEVVKQTCGNPRCVNPEHLMDTTFMAISQSKGRSA